MRKVILVDMENMQHNSYKSMEYLTKDYEIVFFESDHTIKVPVTLLEQLENQGIEYSVQHVERNPNKKDKDTLDFQLVASLAMRSVLVGYEEEYYILSKDSDFIIPAQYISSRVNRPVRVINNLDSLLPQEKVVEEELKNIKKLYEELEKKVNQIIAIKNINETKNPKTDVIIYDCMKEAEDLQSFHTLLQKSLKNIHTNQEIDEIYYDVKRDFIKIRK